MCVCVCVCVCVRVRVRVRAEPNMLKILPIIPSRISQNFDPLFLFYAHIIPIIPTYSCNFIVSVIIMSTIHTVTIILVNRILIV